MIIEPVGLTASIVLTNKLLRHGHGTWDMGHGTWDGYEYYTTLPQECNASV